jgi:predicted HicB family RNase H-like nuclease
MVMTDRRHEAWVHVAAQITRRLHRTLKLQCAQTRTSVMDFVVEALEEKLAKAGRRAPSTRHRRV